MSDSQRGNMLIAQSGGPSMVINQSLVGAVLEARKHESIRGIYGARHGIKGILAEDFLDLRKQTGSILEAVAATLDPGERGRAMILVPTYGQAGAVELLGRGRELPPVYGTQNSTFHWGPPDETMDVAIVAGFGEELLGRVFQEVEPARAHDCTWCMSWRDGMTIWIAREPKFSWREIWPRFKHYE